MFFFFPFCHFALAFACSTYAMQKFYFLKIFFFICVSLPPPPFGL